MSTTYTYNRNPYDQIISWPGYTILPSDGDPFTALSANIYEKTIQDRNMYIWEGLLKNPTMNSSIKIKSTDGVSIIIYPFMVQALDSVSGDYKLLISNKTIIANSSNLLTPGSFSSDTWYYVYVKSDLTGLPEIVIDTTEPHIYRLYKDNLGSEDRTLKYIGNFRVGPTGLIFPFYKNGQMTMYRTSRNILTNGTATAFTNLPIAAFKPIYSNFLYLSISTFNGDVAPNKFFLQGLTSPTPIVTNLHGDTTFQRYLHTSTVYITPDILSRIQYRFQTSGANISKATIDILGYRE